MVLRGGVNGCLDSPKSAAKFLVNVLGLRNRTIVRIEWTYYKFSPRISSPVSSHLLILVELFVISKPCILIFVAELANLNLLTPYTTESVVELGDIDFDSITMAFPTSYALPGTVLFRPFVAVSNTSSATGSFLSHADCFALKSLYSSLACNPSTCTQGSNVTKVTGLLSNSIAGLMVGTEETEFQLDFSRICSKRGPHRTKLVL